MTVNVLELRDLSVRFVRQRTPLDWMLRTRPQVLEAVAGVDLQIERGSIFGIVGESGCGKTTLAKAIVNLVHPEEGDIRFEGKLLGSRRERDTRRSIQMVFQDPSSSLNPLMTVERCSASSWCSTTSFPRTRCGSGAPNCSDLSSCRSHC